MISPLIIQSEGQSLNPVVTIEDNKLCITWTIPKNPIAYDGAIVLVSPQELNPSNYPTNGVKYNASKGSSSMIKIEPTSPYNIMKIITIKPFLNL